MLKATVLPNGKLSVDENPVSHGVLFEEVEFSFPETWSDYVKTAVFSTPDDTVVSVILEDGNRLFTQENRCHIPHEVLNPEGFYLSVFGTKDTSRATTTRVFVNVFKSGYAVGDVPQEPTPSQYEQLVAIAAHSESVASSVRQDADNGVFNGEKGDTGAAGVYYGTAEPDDESHPVWINPEGNTNEIQQEYDPESSEPISGKGISAPISELQRRVSDLETLGSGAVEVINTVYPVGSIYMSVSSISPETLFGGTWEQIKDTFLLSCGDSYTAGATGGEASHTLTKSELPAHTHGSKTLTGKLWNIASQSNVALNASGIVSLMSQEGHSVGSDLTTDYDGFKIDATHEHSSVGNGDAHNNMPPYLAVYMWQRTA